MSVCKSITFPTDQESVLQFLAKARKSSFEFMVTTSVAGCICVSEVFSFVSDCSVAVKVSPVAANSR